MKLKKKTINEIFTALNRLNGRVRVIETEGKPTGHVFEPYAMFATATRVNIIRNLSLLRPHAERFEEDRKALIKHISPDGTGKAIDENPKLALRFNEALEALSNMKESVKGLLLIPWSELDVAKVDPVTVAQLGIVVKDLPKHDDKDIVPDSLGEADDVEQPQVSAPPAV